jgi:hypothetical protein
MITRLLDWSLRKARRDLPDIPEVRRFIRLCWLDGFTSGALERRVAAARTEAFEAISRDALLKQKAEAFDAIRDILGGEL